MIRHDWTSQRLAMVRHQIEARGIRDPQVLLALRAVPRHEFVPEATRHEAYDDSPLPIGHGQTISQPFMVALMTEALRVRGGDKVLEVGTGSGYQAAVLAAMGCEVHTVERDPNLAAQAAARLTSLGWASVRVVVGDGTLGLPDLAPFRGILVTAGSPRVPAPLREQLDPEGGTLVVPVGERGYQELLRVTRQGDEYAEDNLGGCRFVPLIGKEGW